MKRDIPFSLEIRSGKMHLVRSADHLHFHPNNPAILYVHDADGRSSEVVFDHVVRVQTEPETDYRQMGITEAILDSLKRIADWVTAEDVTMHIGINGGCRRRLRHHTSLYGVVSSTLSRLRS